MRGGGVIIIILVRHSSHVLTDFTEYCCYSRSTAIYIWSLILGLLFFNVSWYTLYMLRAICRSVLSVDGADPSNDRQTGITYIKTG